jgi:hypothetical protein
MVAAVPGPSRSSLDEGSDDLRNPSLLEPSVGQRESDPRPKDLRERANFGRVQDGLAREEVEHEQFDRDRAPAQPVAVAATELRVQAFAARSMRLRPAAARTQRRGTLSGQEMWKSCCSFSP